MIPSMYELGLIIDNIYQRFIFNKSIFKSKKTIKDTESLYANDIFIYEVIYKKSLDLDVWMFSKKELHSMISRSFGIR